jgi:hypothetical protein
VSRRRGIALPALALPALALLALAAAGCGESRAPVASFEAGPARLDLPWPEFREIELAFEPLAELPPGDTPIVFLHLLDEPGSVARTFDHPLPAGWAPGKPLRYRFRLYQSALADPLPAGEYLLSAGLYRPGDGRFALRTAAEEIAAQEYRIAVVHVGPPAERMPHARFSESWRATEPGADRQVLARRTLAGGATGTIQFGPVEGAGRLHLALLVPGGGGAHERLEILDGGTQPKVGIGSTCGGGQPELAGTGRFEVDLDLPAAAGARLCEITISSNFQVTTPERAEAGSVRLEVLAWSPAADEAPR